MTIEVGIMNVSLQGARRQSRLDWDAIDQRNQRAEQWPRRVFLAVIVLFIAYLAWNHLAG
jgi:hypothetical protein